MINNIKKIKEEKRREVSEKEGGKKVRRKGREKGTHSGSVNPLDTVAEAVLHDMLHIVRKEPTHCILVQIHYQRIQHVRTSCTHHDELRSIPATSPQIIEQQKAKIPSAYT
jgi:hypothetical protein